jgi:hypothetical protein
MKIEEIVAMKPLSIADAEAEALKRQQSDLKRRQLHVRVAKARERLNAAQQQAASAP